MTSPRPLTLSPTIFCYPSYPVLVSLLLLSPGFNHIFRIVATSLKLMTLTLLLASLPLVSLKGPYLVPPSSLHSSTISLLSSPVTQQFCSARSTRTQWFFFSGFHFQAVYVVSKKARTSHCRCKWPSCSVYYHLLSPFNGLVM